MKGKIKRLLYRLIVLAVVVTTLLVATISPASVLPLGQGIAYASPGWVSPTGFVDGGNVWTAELLAYDEDTVTYAVETIPAVGWGNYLELTHSAINCDRVQVWSSYQSSIDLIEIDVFYNSAWNNIYSGAVTVDAFIEYAIGSEQSVTAMRIRYQAGKANRWVRVHEADFNEVLPPPDISNTPNTWAFGTVSTSSSYETGITYVVDSTGFRITNNVAYDVNITISATGMGSGWLLADSGDPDATHYTLWAGTELTSGLYTIQVTSGGTFLVTVLASSTRDWGLKLMTPTTFSDGGTKTGTVTLTATQA